MKQSAASTENVMQPDNNGIFRVRIEAVQWKYIAYDLNSDPTHSKPMEGNLFFKIGMNESLELTLVSGDLTHGFSINEWGMSYALSRPLPNDEFRPEINTNHSLPDTCREKMLLPCPSQIGEPSSMEKE